MPLAQRRTRRVLLALTPPSQASRSALHALQAHIKTQAARRLALRVRLDRTALLAPARRCCASQDRTEAPREPRARATAPRAPPARLALQAAWRLSRAVQARLLVVMVRASARRVPPANCRRALARRRVMPALLVTTAWLGLRARLGAALARSRLLRARARALAALPASTRARAVRRAASTALLVRIACLARQLQPRAWLEAIGRRSARSRRPTASAAQPARRA